VASAAPVIAGSFKVNPVQITLPADARAASLTITNSGSAPVSIRVQTLAWTQKDGLDVYSPATNVIVSPPIFTIPAGKTQLIRVGLKSRGGTSAYRVIFEEIPRDTPIVGQIQVTLNLNLPLYLLPPGGGKAELGWRAWADRSGAIVVEGRNRGTLHAQVIGLSAAQGGRRQQLSRQMGVVLPGATRLWNVGKHPVLSVGQPLELTVRSPTGETQSRLVLEQR